MIHFGTSGWRSLIAEDFTFDNVRRVVQAIAVHLNNDAGTKGAGFLRFTPSPLSRSSSCDRRIRYTLLKSGVCEDGRGCSRPQWLLAVLFSKEPVPTPVVSFQIIHQKALGAINFTASHNPSDYNGLKFNMASGAPGIAGSDA